MLGAGSAHAGLPWPMDCRKHLPTRQRPSLYGQSLLATLAAAAIRSAGISSLAGVVVIDVVEGTAIASLPYMSTVLQVRTRLCTPVAGASWAVHCLGLLAAAGCGAARR